MNPVNPAASLETALLTAGAQGSQKEWWELFPSPEAAMMCLDCLRHNRDKASAEVKEAAARWLEFVKATFGTACKNIREGMDLGYMARMLHIALPMRLDQLNRREEISAVEAKPVPEEAKVKEPATADGPKGECFNVVRNPGDYRYIRVPVDDLTNFHMRCISGGVGRQSATPMLYARMWCTSIPEGADFGHSCKHGPGPHEILVCITKAMNDGPLYRKIRKTVDPEWGQKRPEQPPFTKTYKVGTFGERTVQAVTGREYEVAPLHPSKKKHRGRKCVLLGYDYDKAIVRFLDTKGRGRVDMWDLKAEGLTEDGGNAKKAGA